MDRYLEIQLRPDPEIVAPVLMGVLVGKLHQALVLLGADDIGASFPGFGLSPRTMGECLRLHATERRLGALMETSWLKGLADHVSCSGQRLVPASAQFRSVRRRQVKSNVERLRRRRMKRKGESYEQASRAIPDSAERYCDLPYVALASQSTGQMFKLFVEQGELQGSPVIGSFNSYGLSNGATVPWF